MDEVETLCDKIAVLNNGQLKTLQTIDSFMFESKNLIVVTVKLATPNISKDQILRIESALQPFVLSGTARLDFSIVKVKTRNFISPIFSEDRCGKKLQYFIRLGEEEKEKDVRLKICSALEKAKLALHAYNYEISRVSLQHVFLNSFLA
jgi:ABC-type multidrug transport system ATPase subunit